MTRAGREPAEDVKRWLVAACQEVGLEVRSATMQLSQAAGVRLIHVDASLPNRPHEVGILSATASISEGGQWPDTVDIRCIASREDPIKLLGPWMLGRGKIPFQDLITELQATLAERDQVIAMVDSGIAGPYFFANSVWKTVERFGPS